MHARARVLLSIAVLALALGAWLWTREAAVDLSAGSATRDGAGSAPPALGEGAPTELAGASAGTASPSSVGAVVEPSAAVPTSPVATAGTARLTGLVRDAKTLAPLFGVRILLGEHERTMHDLRVVARPPLEARTDAEGRFTLEVPAPAEGRTLRVDALLRGYRSASGPYSRGAGRAQEVTLRAGDERSVEVTLVRGFAVAGLVRDDEGRPIEDVQIEAHEEDASSTQYVAFARTDAAGRFEVYDYETGADADGSELAQARLHLDHADHVPLISGDLRTMSEAERTSLDLRMIRGLGIEGFVRTPEGGGAAGLLLEAVHEKQGWRRSVRTERDGSFRVRGVPRGAVALRVSDYVRRLVGHASVALDVESQHVTVELGPIPGNEPRTATRLLGLDLVEITEAERVAYDFPARYRVVVVGADESSESLGVGKLEPGDCIWDLADQPVPDVRALASILVARAAVPVGRPRADGTFRVRVVYGMRREGGFAGTNTQALSVTPAQMDELRAWLAAHPK